MQLSIKARKAMAAGLAASTLLWSAGSILPRVASAAVHSDGCLVLSGGVVWLITGGTRRGFTSAEVFASHGNNFSQVVTATAEDAALPVGPIMTYADGTLVKGPNDPLVYLVAGGQKRPFVSGSVFTGLGYSFANIQQAPVNTFQDLPTGSNLDSSAIAHPAGTVVISGGAIWKMTGTGRMGFPSAAVFSSHGYMFSKVVAANSYDLAMADEGAVAAKPACTTSGGTTPPPTSGSVSLASDNPASSTLVATQAQADLAHFQFGSLGTVTSVTLERIGVSANTTLSNIYLFQGSTRLTDSASMGSDNKVTFAGLNIMTPANISVKSDILTGTAGQTVGVRLVGYTANSTAYNASVSGNLHTIATATLASVALSAPTGGGATDPGNDINVWQGTVAVGTRDVVLNRLALRQIGSIQSSDIRNFRLQVDGIQVAQVQSLDSNGFVTFTPNVTVKNGTRTFKVMADVIGGSGRTYGMSLRGAYDVSTTDSQYNVGIVATLSAAPFGPAAANVNAGSITVVKASDSPSQNLVAGASDAPVGKWTFTAFGEAVKVESLTVAIDTNGTDADNSIRDVSIFVDGSQVGSSSSVTAVDAFATGESFTTNFYVYPGTPRTVEVRADMVDDTATDLIGDGTTTSVQFSLLADTDNAVPQVSLTPTGAPITSNSNANALTIATGTISLAQTSTYPNQTTSAPQSSYKLASWVLSGNSSEAVNINTLAVGFVDTADWDASDDLSNVYLKYGSNTSSIKSTVADGGIATLSNSYSVNTTIPVNGFITVELWGTIGSSVTAADTLIAYLRATGVTASSGTTVYADVDTDTDSTDNGSAGQTITIAAGTHTVSKDASAPVSALLDDSGSAVTGAWKFEALYDNFAITDIVYTIANVSTVSSVKLKDGSTVLATKSPGTTVTFSGLNIPVVSGSPKVLTIELDLSTVSAVGGGTSGSSVLTTLTSATSRNSNGTSAAVTEATANPAGNVMYVYKAVPTVNWETLPATTLTAGTKTLARFNVDSGSTGTVAWKEVLLDISKSADPTIASATLWDVTNGSNTQITAAVAFQNGTAGVATTCSSDNTTCELMVTVGTKADDNVEQLVSGKKTYEIRATLAGNISTGEFVSSTIASNLAHITSNVFTTADNDTTVDDSTFTWSDVSAANHDTGTSDWVNENLLRVLPTQSWTLTAS
jgi:hypothetical protein